MSQDDAVVLTEGFFRWRCRRGMKELDFILNRYLDACYGSMSEVDKTIFNQLLEEQDMLLWYWLSGKRQPADEHQLFSGLVKQICAAGYHQSQ
ncbi:succinate dehydrogenase assembly factor 2 [Marinicella sediminis]|uniref:FAD assembly factor SdhE n=1 Tax=Marinicella sediminis TaxID=1792834 RepID=A0ABV7J6V1_9GAMM|nr:succinate dehydrogenase assembly factor 2 [Marinicella sediminis]